jgi:hypothetical protein
MGIQFLVLFLIPLALQASTLYMRPRNSGTECVGFSKQDACGNLVVASLPVNFPVSAFLPKVSCANVRWTECESYLSYSLKSLNWHFLVWPSPSKATQYSSGMESPRDFQTCASEGQNYDLAKYIVLSTRYEYSIQFIVSYDTIYYF